MSNQEQSSLERFRLKRNLERLRAREGRGTELVTLYVPPGRQISEVVAMLNNEYGTATNIKSNTTRKNVQDAITRVTQRVKLFKQVPKNGLVIFCGAIPQNGPGSEKIETYVISPPEPIQIYLYRCDAKFHTEHLEDFLKEKETYAIIVLDSSDASFATVRGKSLDVIKQITSGIPGKFRAGGQSARRFDRQREAKMQEYFNRIGEHADEIFLPIENLKGILLGGPGPTKFDFEKGNYLHYTLKEKILATLDTSYVDEHGVKEVLDKSEDILRRIRYVEEKKIIQKFLREIGQDTGLASYGEEEVRRQLNNGIVDTLLLSEDIDLVRVTTKCNACDYTEQKTMKPYEVTEYEQQVSNSSCSKCNVPSVAISETIELIDELAELAEQTGTNVEVLSAETEEGQMLKKSFGGIGAILRYKFNG
ncbi:MAG: peptide chain release factor aRF-1 [Candidatus Bathyarchaeota archaeon]|nr:peptide chain release factor aRF-1 [Candidatus Bathyarchaeota archaeon]